MQETVIKAIIVDDEPKSIANLEKHLENISLVEVIATIPGPESAVEEILNKKPDLLFMDIQMPEKNGFEVVEELFKHQFKPDFIFVTAYDEFAIQAVRCCAFDFLVKPVDPEELKKTVYRLVEKRKEQNQEDRIKQLLAQTTSKRKIKISTTGGFTLIRPEDILYIQADWNYAEVFFDTDKSELVTTNIGSLEELLPPNEFFRINRSIIINLTYLEKVSRKKRLAYLKKDEKEYSFKIPLLKIRALEKVLEV